MSFFHKRNEKVTLSTFDGDILLDEQKDRRILPDVPDPTG